MSDSELKGLYEALAGHQWLMRRLSGAKLGDRLEMHKRLATPSDPKTGPGAGTTALNSWLLEQLSPPASASALDLGCGFGGTLLHWGRVLHGPLVGLTSSPFQATKARQQATRLGLGERCIFRVASYAAPIEGRFDLVVAIEALFHAADLNTVINNAAATLVSGGQLVLVEDMAVDSQVAKTDTGSELLSRWHTTHLYTADHYDQALANAGLTTRTSFDLTAQVITAPTTTLLARQRRLRWLRQYALRRRWRALCDAYLGGIALEQLYAAGKMRYRVVIATKRADR